MRPGRGVSAALLWVVFVASCAEDEGSPTGGTGGAAGGTAGQSGATGRTAGQGGVGGEGTPACVPLESAACDNEGDCPFVESGQLDSAAVECRTECVLVEEVESCVVTCLVMELGASASCAACYAAFTSCRAEACFVECAVDPRTAECAACVTEAGCGEEFVECSGVSP